MNAVSEIVTDEELDAVYANANFGSTSKRDVVRFGLLKAASGYYQGHTSTRIITELELVDKKQELTPKGRMYLWAAFSNGSDL